MAEISREGEGGHYSWEREVTVATTLRSCINGWLRPELPSSNGNNIVLYHTITYLLNDMDHQASKTFNLYHNLSPKF